MKKLLVLIGALALTACGGGGGDSGGTSSGFNITAISPANNSQIANNQTFLATFSNQLNPSTIGNVSLTSESGAAIGLNCAASGLTAISCSPVTTLAYASSYTLTYGAGIKNAAGNSLSTTSFNYTTYKNPEIGVVVPSAGAISPNNTKFNIAFAESMQIATLNTAQTPNNVTLTQNATQANKAKAATASKDIPISCVSTDGINMSCSLTSGQLALNESYTLTLTNKIIGSDGVPLIPETINYQTSNFVTPTVTAKPTSGAVGLNQLTYNLIFNTQMSAASLSNKVTFTDTTTGNTNDVDCTTSDNTNFKCTLQSWTILYAGDNFTLNIADGVVSAENIPLAATSFSYAATNFTQPTINFISPPSGAVSLNQVAYNVQFNVPMNMATFTNNVIFKDVTSGNTTPINCTSNDSVNVVCTLQGVTQLTPSHNYTLAFGSGIQDQLLVPLVTTSYNYAATNYTVPTVEYINPQAGPISLNQTTFIIKFNTPMDLSTFTNNVIFTDLTPNPNVDMPITCTSSDKINVQCTLVDVPQLTRNDNYKLSLGAGVKSLAGVSITPTNYNYAATNFTQPHISVISPTPGAISLTQTTFTAQFSEPMKANSWVGNVRMTDSTTGANMPISCSSADNIILYCALQGVSQLTYNHNYVLNYSSGIVSALNVPITSTTYNYSASNAVIPQVASISPTNGAMLSYGTQVFTINFSTTMNTSTYSNINLAGGGALSCTATSNQIATCTASNLTADLSLVLTVPSTVTSAMGVPITAVSYSYITPPTPNVSDTRMWMGSFGEVNVAVYFDRPMNTSTLNIQNITLQYNLNNLNIFCRAMSDVEVLCQLNSGGTAGTYTVFLNSNILSAQQAPLKPYSYSKALQ